MKAKGKVYCSRCNRLVAGYVPRHGDGTVLYTFRHAPMVNLGSCPGSYAPGYSPMLTKTEKTS